MIRRNPALASAALAALATLVSACSTDAAPSSPDPSTPDLSTSTAAVDQGFIDLEPISAGTALDPGTYGMPLIGLDSRMRVLVDVPAGYFSSGGYVIDDGHGTLVPDEYGDVAFWGAVTEVGTDPCLGAKSVDAGTSVRDLADALVAQRHWRTSAPVPVTLDGYRGVYLESTGPQDLMRCRAGDLVILADEQGNALSLGTDMRGTTRLWILDVRGTRIVAAVRTFPGHTSDPEELVGIAESAEFRFAEHS